ncbi:MAG: histidine phosphatase family protein [Pseudanabaenaceae cyanobacterium SKYGB_i_bin29]|nr:histidine phosphatase family protein [Pseudanabaenaceae cyanobacterium SKYG29]MDW8421604.1 histidine phosphatase family protein [Pseudanabaenaceae cyanobacterium SKYGB_i_bin29]
MSNLTLYFLRHGETTYSQVGGYCGNLDPHLTEAGTEMAQAFADFYADFPWTAIYVSPMTRTIETAQPLCDRIGKEMILRQGLKEIAYGEWEGMMPEEVKEKYHDAYLLWLADPGWNAPVGGERAVDIARRSGAVIAEIQETFTSGNVLIVSHKATIRIMLCSLLGIDVGRFRDRIAIPVASVSIVEMAKRGPLVQVMGDRSHLPPHLRQREGH